MSDDVKNNKFSFPVFSIVTYIISTVFIGLGFHKMFAYNNGESYPYKLVNAYVGGDAYNYIINANLATAYFILALIFVLLGSTVAVVMAIKWSTAKSQLAEVLRQDSGSKPKVYDDLPGL